MTKTKQKSRGQGCPVTTTVELIGGKWKTVALYHLLSSPKRFSELQRRLTGVTQRMLTLQLRELEADGLVHREVYPQVPPKVEYSLTEHGRSLEPILRAMVEWGRAHQLQGQPVSEQVQ
ncbi:winged helix-turn-helix transcriptional regulator [Deinococcus aquatilis]|uniref:winged helix-turn-helix transcriptional regulator n=1 Tax=Deinococcus aquatilis TaxID=519440 RepID=UPI00036826F8|nr:helix-turn-helix domain-containing protein [Deinococcus aquatilis]